MTRIAPARIVSKTKTKKSEERCTATLFGTTMVMAVYAPDSKKSLEMHEDCISSVVKVLREGRRAVPGRDMTRTLASKKKKKTW